MKYHILAIGVSKHMVAKPDLEYAHEDARDFFELFRSNVPNLGSAQLLIDSEATLSGIRTALAARELQQSDNDDAFFFFFSGHGTVAQDMEGAAHYLVTYDATGDYATSCVSVEYLREAFKGIPCKAQFIFVDSCFSGAVGSGVKFLPGPTLKAPVRVKKLTEVIPGEGNVVLTACKDDELALEVPTLKHGLFTYSVLEELQKSRGGSQYPIAEIFDPIAQTVSKHAKDYNRVQTATITSHLVGSVQLPVFRQPLQVSPDLLEPPRFPELTSEQYTPPKITLSDKKQEAILNDLVLLARQSVSQKGLPDYKRFVWQLINMLKQEWENIFQSTTRVEDVPDAISKLEGQAFQCLALGGVLAVYGTEYQIREYAEAVVSLLDLTEARAGFTVVINIPKVVLLLTTYVLGTVGLEYRNLKALEIFLDTRFIGQRTDRDPVPIRELYSWHYLDSLGGAATKACDHVRDVLGGYSWLQSLAPRMTGNVTDTQLQVNFLLYMNYSAHGVQFWPDFARFGGEHIRPLIERLKFDQQLIEQVASLLKVSPCQPPIFRHSFCSYFPAFTR